MSGLAVVPAWGVPSSTAPAFRSDAIALVEVGRGSTTHPCPAHREEEEEEKKGKGKEMRIDLLLRARELGRDEGGGGE